MSKNMSRVGGSYASRRGLLLRNTICSRDKRPPSQQDHCTYWIRKRRGDFRCNASRVKSRWQATNMSCGSLECPSRTKKRTAPTLAEMQFDTYLNLLGYCFERPHCESSDPPKTQKQKKQERKRTKNRAWCTSGFPFTTKKGTLQKSAPGFSHEMNLTDISFLTPPRNVNHMIGTNR